MFTWFKRLLLTDIDHILSDFHEAVSRLEEHSAAMWRKADKTRDKAVLLRIKAAVKDKLAEDHIEVANKAKGIADKIKELVA